MDFCNPWISEIECTVDIATALQCLVIVLVGISCFVIPWCRLGKDRWKKRCWVRYPGNKIRWILTVTLVFFLVVVILLQKTHLLHSPSFDIMEFCSPGVAETECKMDVAVTIQCTVVIVVGLSCFVITWCRLGRNRWKQRSWVRYPGHTLRWIVTIVLIFFQILEFTEGIISGFESQNVHHVQLYVPSLLSILTSFLTLIYYDFCESLNLPKLLSLSFGYWTAGFVLKLIKLTTLYREGFDTDTARVLLTWITISLNFVLLLVEMFCFGRQTYLRRRGIYLLAAEEAESLTYVHPYTNLFSRATWNWLTPVLRLGYKKTLLMPDLGLIPETEHSKTNLDLLRQAFNEEKKGKTSPDQVSLWRCYWKAYWPAILLGGIFKLFGSLTMYVSPLLLDTIVTYVEVQLEYAALHNTTEIREPERVLVPLDIFLRNGYVLSLFVMASMFLRATFEQNSTYLSMREGIRIKAGLQAMVYDKALKLPSWLLNDGTMDSGQVMNHMNVDPVNVCMFFAMCHISWCMIFDLVCVLILLYVKLGYAAVISATVFLVIFPVQYFLSKKLGQAHKGALMRADERIKKCNEVLQSMKLIKLFAWEGIFEKSILRTRAAEIQQLFRGVICRIFAMFLSDGGPILALLVTFLLIPHVEKKPMDVGRVFSGLALFTILTFPMYILTMMLDLTITAVVSSRRLVPFFLAPELDEESSDSESSHQDHETTKCINGTIKHNGVAPDTTPLLLTHNRRSTQDNQDVPVVLNEATALKMTNASFSWDLQGTKAILSGINVTLPKGELTVIVGPVGCGKSSLLCAMFGEMTTVTGTVTWNKNLSISYGAQKAWLLNASLKDNILFGKIEEPNRYKAILEACALKSDLEMLPAGDQTEIGEKGINLSGGQKQRISIARLLYSQTDVVILDDPLSALDVHVGAHIYQHAIKSFLLEQNKTVILVTHQLQYVPHAAMVLVMEDGQIKHQGTPEDIREADPELYDTWCAPANSQSKNSEDNGTSKILTHSDKWDGPPSTTTSLGAAVSAKSLAEDDEFMLRDQKEVVEGAGRLTEDEEHQEGSVAWSVYFQYCVAGSIWLSIGTLLSYALRQTMKVFLDLWLANWAQAAHGSMKQDIQHLNKSANESIRDIEHALDSYKHPYDVAYYSKVFAMKSCACLVAGFIAISFLEFLGLTAAKRLHNNMITSIPKAPMRFFDKTPLGRIINRISGDVHLIDINIPFSLDNYLYCLVALLAGLIVNGVATPFFLLTTVPVIGVFFVVQKFYIASSRELKRLDSITKSPIMSHFSETISGLATIRAFGVRTRFRERIWQNIDANSTTFLYLQTSNVWMGIRLDYLCTFVVFFASVCSLSAGLNGHVSPAIVGLAITYALNIAWLGQWFVRAMSEMEMYFTSVERVIEMAEITPEEQPSKTGPDAPDDWPSTGKIQFKNVSLSYDKHLDPVVNGINLVIEPGQKVGLCGRTGSGKSSLTLGLFRMIDICQGQIFIDDLDITDVRLHTLRSRLSIIPQDPVLFEGDIRYNLDPEGVKSEAEIWRALEIAQLKPLITALSSQLNTNISEGGENFSVGQRQLFCLARAVLRDSPILIMDEATASIDVETDHLVQKVIQDAFKDRTVITIAHRIGTILNSDMIVLLKDGQILEHDTPSNLLSYNSAFSTLVNGEKDV